VYPGNLIINLFIHFLQLEELPFLLTMAGEKERLKATVSNLDVFRYLIKGEAGKFELIKAWKLVSHQ
jgi:hypothetical protein